MNAIELLKSQHRNVEELFSKIGGAQDSNEKERTFIELADSLAIHTSIEEHHFYPGVNQQATEEILLESVEEHLGIKRVLSDLLEIPVDDQTFDAKLKVLEDLVSHHVEEEETTLFPKIAGTVDEADLDEIAAAMREEQAELQERGDAREAVQTETERAAPI
jgi:hypothetical protein